MQQLTDILQVNQAIMFGTWTNVEIQSMVDAIKFARANLARQNKRAFKTGDIVKFTSNRDGRSYNGHIEKIKIKYILIRTSAGLYNVPASMVEAV